MSADRSAAPLWATAPAHPALGPADVHIWRIDLAAAPETYAAHLEALGADERRRAERLVFAHHRRRFATAHVAVRRILSRYLAVAPAELAFRVGAYGKPALAHPSADLRFNLSHSHDLALLAVAQGRAVGVDLEQIQPGALQDALARQVCSPAELVALAGLAAEARAEAFYQLWTRKEALIKGRGDGLARPLTAFTVTLLPGEPARVVASTDPSDLARWSLHALDPGPGYAGALAVADGPVLLAGYCYAEGD